MAEREDIQRFVRDPSKLVQLCSEVIDELTAVLGDDSGVEAEAQLQEISRSIERLEGMGISVPDVLRGEKTRLAAAAGRTSEALSALSVLVPELDKLLYDSKKRLAPFSRLATSRGPSSLLGRGERTSRLVLREYIVQALKRLGGSATRLQVFTEMEKLLNNRLLPGDQAWNPKKNLPVWKMAAAKERDEMVRIGLLRGDSPAGTWELQEEGQ